MAEDKLEEIKKTINVSATSIVLILVGVIVLFAVYFLLVGNDNVPAEHELASDQATKAAQIAFAEELNQANAEAIEVEDIEEREWPNSCLGLAEPQEICTQTTAPGYLISLTYQSETDTYYATYRTDEVGSNVRLESLNTQN